LSADQPFRTQQIFAHARGAHGGANIAAHVRVVLEVRSISLADPPAEAVTVLHDAVLADLPGFAYYAPVNAGDLHIAANFLQVTLPIQARLATQKPGEAEAIRPLGFGLARHDATITADPHRNQWALEFYEDTIPLRGERITLTYRAAGAACARVIDPASIAAEAAVAGDDGRRAVVLSDVAPPPRSSVEAELAALAYLDEHTAARYEGRYTTWGSFAESWPRPGGLLQVRTPARQPEFSALVRGVTSELRELGGEHILHTLDFGQPSHFEDLLRRFTPADQVLAPEAESPPEVERAETGTSFIADAPAFRLADFNPAEFTVDMGAPPPPGGRYEVRRSDQGWSTGTTAGSGQNLLGTFATASFTLPRSGEVQRFFIRPVAGTGQTSRYASLLAMHFPPVPSAPDAVAVRLTSDGQQMPVIEVSVAIPETALAGVDAVELRAGDNVTVLARWEFGQLQMEGATYFARFAQDNSAALARSATFQALTQNALSEYSPARGGSGAQAQPAKPVLTPGNSVGQILEILLDVLPAIILETQVQVAAPGVSFSSPSQDISVPGQPEKFNFVATQSGGWGFRARRRDALGWSPWSDEQQGQIPPQSMVFSVQFFRADELDPSIGAAINGQNLLPNSEFFLTGIAGQEGTHAARYFGLVAAAGDGSEVDYSTGTNEMKWKSGVIFAAANPGFRSWLSNLGHLLNPGETVTFSAALRHTGSGTFGKVVRLALRSATVSSYDQTRDVPLGSIAGDYRWYSAVFLLPAGQAVPGDLAAELTVVAQAGQSLASELHCDKVILNRGERPAAFSLSPWDVVPLAWNSSAGAYDLPATIAGGAARPTDPGNAGRLAGTGTEDLDPEFTGRYTRLPA
jgi:hypothetical protein